MGDLLIGEIYRVMVGPKALGQLPAFHTSHNQAHYEFINLT